MSNPLSSHQLWPFIKPLVGDLKVRKFKLESNLDEAVTITIEYLGDYDHVTQTIEALTKEFNLIPKEQ